ncbi:MAG: carboxylating nicotinate-nucleotide diphosphorylase [Candidatus Coatesbacteria bacterium]|nr:MAG: carboxylating nicotinate-nucleotide diphosphorylase [Candidatus Coatesbacteria bacterium]
MNPVDKIIALALEEDASHNDVTSRAVVPPTVRVKARITARQRLIVSGSAAALRVFEMIDPSVSAQLKVGDGVEVLSGDVIANIEGLARSILAGERVALNLLQQLCGVATLTREFCSAIKGTSAKIVDTRKTLPGLRALQKQAVLDGGGVNHRMSLADGVLIKDNHIAAAGSISEAVEMARRGAHHLLKIEVEVETLDGVREALGAGADVVMLDNMPVEMIAAAVKLIDGRAVVEASGGITLNNVLEVAEAGVDLISVGQLTHSAPACDISVDFMQS